MFYLSLRTVLIRNASGTHDQQIERNTPTYVIPKLYDAANAAGCVPCDEKGNVIQPEDDAVVVAQPAPAAAAGLEVDPDPAPVAEVETVSYTQDDVEMAVKALIARNNKSDFAPGTGRPKVAPVAEVLGSKPTLAEVEAAFQAVNAED